MKWIFLLLLICPFMFGQDHNNHNNPFDNEYEYKNQMEFSEKHAKFWATYLEYDYQEKIREFAKIWNEWMEIRKHRSSGVFDFKMVCAERRKLEKLEKLMNKLIDHEVSPCEICRK